MRNVRVNGFGILGSAVPGQPHAYCSWTDEDGVDHLIDTALDDFGQPSAEALLDAPLEIVELLGALCRKWEGLLTRRQVCT